MARTVYPNNVVAHLWGNQSQPEARSGNGNVSFVGPVLYSYTTPIANIVQGVALVTSHSYSVTTSAHVSRACGSFPGQTFVVPSLGVYGGRLYRGGGDPTGGPNHARNLAYLVGEYDKTLASDRRSREALHDWKAHHLRRLADRAMEYAAAFGLAPPVFNVANDIAAAEEHIMARLTSPAAMRRAAKAAERRLLTQRLNAADAEERIAAWRAGTLNSLRPADARHEAGALLRVRRDTLETSMGARVPLPDAIRVFRSVKACRDAGRTWKRNGETLPVGQFQVDHINADGSFRAGCHLILWPEVAQAAIAAGVMDPTP